MSQELTVLDILREFAWRREQGMVCTCSSGHPERFTDVTIVYVIEASKKCPVHRAYWDMTEKGS